MNYEPRAAWRRALIYFALCWALAAATGALERAFGGPLMFADQRSDPVWWAATGLGALIIIVAYGVIWPRGTFTDGRIARPWLSTAFGAVWGLSQGLLFTVLWMAAEVTGLGVAWVALISYLLIGAYNALWHSRYWDIRVSPPHNYREWNLRKVLACHTPNLVFCMAYLAWSGSFGVFVLLQALALALSARAMRFPAWWDDYRARAGEERSRSA